jgi:hypothetical protein
MRSPSISPFEPFTAPVHLVLCDFGKLGNAYVETEPVMTEAAVVENMLAGQYDRPLEVVAFNVSDGWSRDVSEGIAALVVERARSEERPLSEGARRFVEKHLDEELEPELCR